MRTDLYVKVLLTIIAGCLVALTFRGGSVMTGVRASTATTCTGELKSTSSGPIHTSTGGSYSIHVTCN
jgi:hypothetical protein